MILNQYSRILKLFIHRRSIIISSPLIFYGTKQRFEFFFWFMILNGRLHINWNIGSWWIEW